jgi:hypothetical protein
MEALYKEYAERDVVFLAVALPWSSPHYENVPMTQFLSEYNSSLTYVSDAKNALSSAHDVQSIPSVFVLSMTGEVYASFPGVMPSSDVAVAIDEALGYLPVALMNQTETAGDTSGEQGQPVAADSYLDITEVAFGRLGPTYVFNITVAGPLPPASSASTSIFVEWEVLIDLDQNSATHSWSYPLVDNGIDVDAFARLTWYNGTYEGELRTWPGGRRTSQSIGYRINGAVATLYVEASTLDNPSGFDFVCSVRKYTEPGDTLIVADKAPDQGHLRYANGLVTTASDLLSTPEFYHLSS